MIIEGKQYRFDIEGRSFHCAMDVVMSFLGGKWKAVVLWYLRNKTMRFGELRKQIPDITEKMLSLQLKALESDGLVRRKAFAEVPLRVEYSLTEKGKSMIPLLEEMAAWGRNYARENGELVEISD